MELTQKILQEILHYDPETGVFIWKSRPTEHFASDHGYRRYQRNFPNKSAGSVNKYSGYMIMNISLQGKRAGYFAHRLAWFYIYGVWPDNQIDHINRDRSDNRISNLRSVDDLENRKNMGLSSRNKSGCTGVYWRANRNKWQVQITVNYKTKTVGHFDSKDEAIAARRRAEIELGFHPNHGR